MKNVGNIVGKNLNTVRKNKGLSLDKTAALTGVSKAMLGQIERGESNPTVATLWKIATGLKVSFSSFLKESQVSGEPCFIAGDEINPVEEEKGLMKIYPLFHFDSQRGFELFTIQLEPGCVHSSQPHDNSVEEYVMVTEGEMEMLVDGKEYKLKKGDALRYQANVEHTYRNLSDRLVFFQHLIYYSVR